MPETYADRVCDLAESQVGIHESGGRNRGGCEKYQRPWGSWMVGQPWCGAFVAWVWEGVGLDGMHLASPSTDMMCVIAQSRGLQCSPRPGAAFVHCGTHTGLLVRHISGSVWKTVEGNSGDAVNWRQHSIGGYTIYAPPGISKGDTTPGPTHEAWYYIEDPKMHGVREFGGWDNRKKRNSNFTKRLRIVGPNKLRKFQRGYPNPDNPFFFEDVTQPPRYYGGWRNDASRDLALGNLEEKYNREMRPFTIKRKV